MSRASSVSLVIFSNCVRAIALKAVTMEVSVRSGEHFALPDASSELWCKMDAQR
jgi:hypothetical protein